MVASAISLVAGLIIASAPPIVTKLLEDDPPGPRGAPTDTWEAASKQGEYTVVASVSVANRTLDPLQRYEPLNSDAALRVTYKDILDFELSCSMSTNKGPVKPELLILTVPEGLEIVAEPRMSTLPQDEGRAAVQSEEFVWGWLGSSAKSNDVVVRFTASVDMEQPAYLVVSWLCTRSEERNVVDHSSRAILMVEGD